AGAAPAWPGAAPAADAPQRPAAPFPDPQVPAQPQPHAGYGFPHGRPPAPDAWQAQNPYGLPQEGQAPAQPHAGYGFPQQGQVPAQPPAGYGFPHAQPSAGPAQPDGGHGVPGPPDRQAHPRSH
ncbi:hypothetical protein MW084_19880, partial [Streptomyces sudanensis]